MQNTILRLKKKIHIEQVFKKGKSVATKKTVLYYKENDLGISRVAFSIKKRIGNSVVRNRIRRLYYEVLRNKRKNMAQSYDFLLIIRRSDPSLLKYKVVKKDLDLLLQRGGIKEKGE